MCPCTVVLTFVAFETLINCRDGQYSLLRYLTAVEEISSFVERCTSGTQRSSAQPEAVRVQRQIPLTLQGMSRSY